MFDKFVITEDAIIGTKVKNGVTKNILRIPYKVDPETYSIHMECSREFLEDFIAMINKN